eukprot:GHVN01049539.1.p1 GENE.GHVN01049539.1~~GHVN01049539.1.p1  ORF type:complete len:218 (-),score=24.09 GHVN01049539.1:99-752(-)
MKGMALRLAKYNVRKAFHSNLAFSVCRRARNLTPILPPATRSRQAIGSSEMGVCRKSYNSSLSQWNSRRGFATQASSNVTEGQEEVMAFQAETNKLLQIVANSLYTDPEVFLRELISNSSDALEKLRFLQVSGKAADVVDPEAKLAIRLECNPTDKTFSIVDTGLGMTRDELVANIGTIARSGSSEFLQKTGDALKTGEKLDSSNIIGQVSERNKFV